MIIPKGLTHKDLKTYLSDNYRNLKLNSEFKNGSTKVEIICKIDDHKWNVFPRDIYDGTNMSCSECNRRNANLQIKQEFQYEYPGLKIITMDIFKSPMVRIKCEDCGHEFEVYRKHLIGDNIRNFSEPIDLEYITFFKGKKKLFKCPVCDINKTKGFFEIVAKERNVTIVGEYKNNTTTVDVKCNKCGTIYGVVPSYYVNKITSNCKFCKIKKRGKKNVQKKETDSTRNQ